MSFTTEAASVALQLAPRRRVDAVEQLRGALGALGAQAGRHARGRRCEVCPTGLPLHPRCFNQRALLRVERGRSAHVAERRVDLLAEPPDAAGGGGILARQIARSDGRSEQRDLDVAHRFHFLRHVVHDAFQRREQRRQG